MSEQGNNNSLWDLLSPDLVTEILTRLPAKPLARFKSVSKHWNSLISCPRFLISYINRPFPSSWVILNKIPQLVPESTRYVTQFQLVEPPNVSPSSINPFKLAAEPITDPNRSKYPTAILHSSSGLLLCTLQIVRDPHKEHEKDPTSFGWIFEEEYLFVVNPVTHEWVPLPKPQRMINKRTHVVFTTRVDPTTGFVDKFMVAEYQPIIGSKFANLLCFSSDNGKWVNKSANYMLGMHFWRAEGSFEFEGKFFWVDLSAALITWDSPGNDPFVELENKKLALCRYIPLPSGRVKPFNTPGLEHERCISPGGGFIQYIEVFKGDNSLLKLWRLMGCESGSEEWSLKYKVSLNCIERNISFELKKGMPDPCFVHPFEADVVYFGMGDYLLSLNVRTRKVETCVTCVGINKKSFVLPMVLSKWPSPLPKRFYVAYAREQGNECFKSQKFTEAIECYSKSIDLSPNAVAFANRAMAYIKINKFHEAESDCTESMKLDANYFKVYWRRALARKELGYFQGAWEDAEFGLKFEPDNKELKKLRDELKSVLEKASCEEPIHDEKGAAKDIDLEST